MTSEEKNSKDKKLEITHAARDFFLDKGYEKTTMVDIIAKLEIPEISVYRYFKSKDELLEAVIEDFISGYIEKLKVALEKTKGDAFERIRILRAADRNFVKEHKEALQKLHSADNVKFHTWQLAVACVKMASLFAQIIEQGCEEGVFKTDHPLESAEFLLSGIQFLTDEGVYPWKGEDLSRRAKAIPFVLEALLKAPKGSLAFLAK